MDRASKPVPEGIIQLQRQLEQFRSTHPLRTKLPAAIWLSAVELARQHGVNSVAHPLRLDYGSPASELSGARQTAGRGSRGKLSRRVPLRVGDVGPGVWV